jgi:predicted house-cleaning noncanonical NTP pyrophosphatase (MazG superfamily)
MWNKILECFQKIIKDEFPEITSKSNHRIAVRFLNETKNVLQERDQWVQDIMSKIDLMDSNGRREFLDYLKFKVEQSEARNRNEIEG